MMPRLLVVPNPVPESSAWSSGWVDTTLRAWHRLVMANFETLAVSVDDTIGRIQLNRPAQLNPLSTTCLRELVAAADWFDARTRCGW